MLKYLYGKLPVASKLNGGREERMGGVMMKGRDRVFKDFSNQYLELEKVFK